MTGAERLRVGLAGLGRFGKLHAAVLSAMPNVSVAAVSDPRRDETAAFASAIPGIKTFDGFETMLDNSELDAVFIVTPEPLHAAQALAAIEHRVPDFVDVQAGGG